MKVIRYITAAILGICMLLSGCDGASGGSSDTDTRTVIIHDFGANDAELYVALGDSITNNGKEESGPPYPLRLSSLLGKTVVNEGIAGERSTVGAERAPQVLSLYQPGYLLILYGANDVIHLKATSKVIANLRSIINDSRDNGTIPVLATLLPMIGPRIGWASGVQRLNDEIRILAAEEGVLLVDLEFEFLVDPEAYLLDDGVHPSYLGTDVIANTFFAVLSDIKVQSP